MEDSESNGHKGCALMVTTCWASRESEAGGNEENMGRERLVEQREVQESFRDV